MSILRYILDSLIMEADADGNPVHPERYARKPAPIARVTTILDACERLARKPIVDMLWRDETPETITNRPSQAYHAALAQSIHEQRQPWWHGIVVFVGLSAGIALIFVFAFLMGGR